MLDEQGRRRFHGAFTGGFSAGYYNSVGSKEGWTPSTFRSSRKDKEKRADAKGQAVGSRPEDFMDEEDLEALREGRGALGSTQMYGSEQPMQAERDPLMDMLGLGNERAVTETVTTSSSIRVSSSSLGTSILQRMGWRPGQGLGPRVSFKRRNELLAMLGKPVPKDEMQDKEAQKHMWPPPDTPMPIFSTKQDAKGLGWTGNDHNVSLDEALKRARAETESRPVVAGKMTGGFGLGALEEDSDGEDDVYAVGNRREESTLASRHAQHWGTDSDRIVLGSNTETEKARPELEKARIESSDNVWHDGRAMIVGFRIASKSSEKEVWFEAPDVPKGWEPNPQQVWSKASTEKAKGQPGVSINSADRASILGEARLPGPPPSIKDYLSQKDKERLQRGAEAAKQIASGNFATAAGENKTLSEIPRLDAAVAKAALQGYIPFASEPDKQERYRAYLSSQATSTESPPTLRPSSHQTHQQFIAELNDFAKSAGIFKPLSTVMASRFQSSVTGSSEMPQINPGLYKPEPKPALTQGQEEQRKREDEEEKQKEELQTMTSFQRNARLGLFGKETTRKVSIWKPSRLLCKRFNVPMPHADEEEVKGEGEEDVMAAFGASKIKQMDMPKVNARWEESKRQLQQLAAQRSVEGDQSRSHLQSESETTKQESDTSQARGGGSGGVVDINNIGLGEVQEKEEDVAFVKPSMDVFKAVFADDDSDDDEEEVVEERNGKDATVLFEEETEDTMQAQPIEKTAEEETTADLRPTFVPRKRRTEEVNGQKSDKKKKKDRKKSLLTFSIDEEEESIQQIKATTAPSPSSSKASRPRAADLFN